MYRKSHKSTKIVWLSAVCLLCLLPPLSGCSVSIDTGGTTGTDTEFSTETGKAVIDDFAALALEMDSYSAKYDAVLDTVGTYAESGLAADLSAAAAALSDALTWAEDTGASLTTYEISSDLSSLLTEVGFSRRKYLQYAGERSDNLESYLENLNALADALIDCKENAEAFDEFVFLYDIVVSEQDCMRQYGWLEVNYWFADWNTELTAYVQQEILANLQSFYSGSAEWNSDASAVDTQMDALLDTCSELAKQLSDHIGDTQEKLYNLSE